jgi:predicted DNA-binding transcriptional regulator YafY
MRKADRLFQLTNLIRAKQPITAEKIATELQVSVRTIYRYIDDLSVSGIPIYGTTGIGYQLDDDFELPPLNLTEKELEALLLGMKMVSGWSGIELSYAAQSLSSKIQSVLPKHMVDDYSDVVFAPDFVHDKGQKRLWENIHQTIKTLNTIKIKYHSLDKVISHRTLYPLGLVYWGSKWTLAAWCTKRNDFRNFRVDRIFELDVLDTPFELTDKINLQTFLATTRKD